ncbi:hypothetical protein Daura_28885 [Dactylosporangium aurantiacum]|uniref:Uncharacterized protein n=1 Tax=Dactylosporangium aurantiacum TaxID=35754 RepID=A0A9Q9IAG4_9ACTN|nr:hypothetical protein [Dactylosporangium aurantiacum]MDG6106669.1 hypothetical protein [Dactylosporangium aurantiacum]UWZ50825.1 hypothetical protein Daura_28885 [Dactylosporangium aurantiacum]
MKWASRVAVAGAVVQIVYGLLACVFRYPTITDRPFELLWALVNLAMIANIAVWLATRVASPVLAAIGGGLAVVGHLLRAGISLFLAFQPDAEVDTPIVATVMLMFLGMALIGIATVRAKRLTGRPAWAPLLVLAGGIVAAPFYSFDKVVHFILLGLLWGSTWLYLAAVGRRNLNSRGHRQAAVGAAAPAASEVG